MTENLNKTSTGSRIASILNRFGPVFGLIGIYILFVVIGPDSFASVRNLETIARQTSIIAIAALGMTMVIILGGIDLSVGSVVALSTVVIATVLQKMAGAAASGNIFDVHIGVAAALLAGLYGVLAGLAAGFFNGTLITRLKVVPFIVTLGSLLLFRGAAKGLAHEQKVNAPLSWLNEMLASLPPDRRWMLVSPGVWLMIILAVLVAVLLRCTRLGRHIYAVGSNELTARLCGVAVEKVKMIVYSLAGAFAGLAGLMQFSRLSVGDPTVAVGLELDVIAAVVIGGGSLSGGEGSVIGTMVGALIMAVIRSGCTQMGLPNWVQEIVTGAIIVIAVALDRLRHRKMA